MRGNLGRDGGGLQRHTSCVARVLVAGVALLFFVAPLLFVVAPPSAFADSKDRKAAADARAATKLAHAAAKEADAAWNNGDFAAVLRHAEAGLQHADLADLKFLKARALWAVGQHETAWTMMKAFSPGALHARYQDVFVVEYERMEREIKHERSAQSRVRRLKHSLAKHRDTDEMRGTVSMLFWAGAAAGIALGGGLLAYGIYTHGDVHDPGDKQTAMYLASAGGLLAGGGGGFAIAALVISPSGPVMKTTLAPVGPPAAPALVWSAKF